MIGNQSRVRVFAAIVVTVVMLPIVQNFREKPVDSFPLSYYPMFSAKRDGPQKLTYLVGVGPDGARAFLPYNLAGTGGMNQVRKQLAKNTRRSRADELCGKVAGRLAKKDDRGVQRVMVVTGWHDMSRFFSGDRKPVKQEVHAECMVKGASRP